jgi:hypothetical protein
MPSLKSKYRFKRRTWMRGYCMTCLNFEDLGVVRIETTNTKSCYGRYVRAGSCHMAGWEVTSIDCCSSWQDDA